MRLKSFHIRVFRNVIDSGLIEVADNTCLVGKNEAGKSAIIGALSVNAGKTWFTGMLPELWLFALGALFVLVTLFLPKGILGTFLEAYGFRRRRPDPEIEDEDGVTRPASTVSAPGAVTAPASRPLPAE